DEPKSIVVNGGLEEGDPKGTTPESWKQGAQLAGVKYQWDRTTSHEGKASLHFRKTAQRYFPIAQWFQVVDRTGKTPRLKVSTFVKAEKMTKAILDVQFQQPNGQASHEWVAYIGAKEDNDPPATHGWKRYEGVVTIPEGTEKLIIAAQVYGPGDVW